jgi:hypothetical protein
VGNIRPANLLPLPEEVHSPGEASMHLVGAKAKLSRPNSMSASSDLVSANLASASMGTASLESQEWMGACSRIA